MRILVTNDDGIHAPGLRTLANVARQFGEVIVVAPDRERSACAHAMTMRDPLRVHRVPYDGLEAYEVNGFPVDCVNVGLTIGFPDQSDPDQSDPGQPDPSRPDPSRPGQPTCDLVLSGINNGPNLGFDITYSGTVAGAMEGTINGIRSIAVSMALLKHGETIDYGFAETWLLANWDLLAEIELPELTFLNINVPNHSPRGTRFAAMGRRVYKDRVEMREDPWGRPYYWQGGVVVMDRHQPGTDVSAVMDGYTSVTPVSLDWTQPELLARLQSETTKP
ncbi:MAG: 5'/3'-nucleotidase SurE [Fimbriimonadaceae bacterium]|nr:5'/3'-nucleotidase SurE [Fimbriimonadaceae bacterium]